LVRNSPVTASAIAANAQLQQAIAFLQSGQPHKSRALCESLLKHNARHAEALHLMGVLAYQAGQLLDARRFIAKAIAVNPRNASFHTNLGNVLQDLKQSSQAIDSYNRALEIQPDLAETHYNRAFALETLGCTDDAVAGYTRAIALRPQFSAAYYNRALAFEHARRFPEAVADYDRAIALTPDNAAIHYNRGNALQEVENYEEALASYDRAIALNPTLAAPRLNRGTTLGKLGRHAEAVESYRSVLTLEPGHVEARKNILWSAISHPAPATNLDALIQETCAATAVREAESLRATKTLRPFRLHHDLEQSTHLISQGFEELNEFHACLKGIAARKPRNGLYQLSDSEIEIIAHAPQSILSDETGVSASPCLNSANDWHGLEEQYVTGTPEIVVIDNLLSPAALIELRAFCLASTVWKSEYDNHYLGAFATDGFVNPLLLKIAQELRERMPRIFGDHTLEQLWGFKYDSKMGRGINVHADFARINLNFWITPEDANLNSESGGMVIYDVPAPRSWSFQEYNNDPKRIYGFLAEKQASKRVVPYRCNRAVLFNSNLFHETDTIHFKDGYENRRINITYLFGRGLAD